LKEYTFKDEANGLNAKFELLEAFGDFVEDLDLDGRAAGRHELHDCVCYRNLNMDRGCVALFGARSRRSWVNVSLTF
jgi:hypothetical protein